MPPLALVALEELAFSHQLLGQQPITRGVEEDVYHPELKALVGLVEEG